MQDQPHTSNEPTAYIKRNILHVNWGNQSKGNDPRLPLFLPCGGLVLCPAVGRLRLQGLQQPKWLRLQIWRPVGVKRPGQRSLEGGGSLSHSSRQRKGVAEVNCYNFLDENLKFHTNEDNARKASPWHSSKQGDRVAKYKKMTNLNRKNLTSGGRRASWQNFRGKVSGKKCILDQTHQFWHFPNQICQACISKMQKMLRICLLNIFLSSHSYIDAIGLWVWAKPFSCNLVPQNQSTILNTEGHFWEDVQYNSRLCNNGKFYRQHFLSILEKKNTLHVFHYKYFVPM